MKTRTAFLLVFALVVSACQIRFDTAVVINADGSGTFAIEISLDEEFRQLSEDQGGGDLDMTDGFEEDPPPLLLDEERPTREGNAVAVVRLDPPCPQRLWGVSKHRPAVQTLAVPEHRADQHRPCCLLLGA